MKKNKSKNTKLNIVLAILCAILIIIDIVSGFPNEKKISLKNDYYEYTNKEILEANELESGENEWSLFSEMQEKVDDKLITLVKDTVDKNKNENITKLYSSVINPKNDLSLINSYIEDIDNSNNIYRNAQYLQELAGYT